MSLLGLGHPMPHLPYQIGAPMPGMEQPQAPQMPPEQAQGGLLAAGAPPQQPQGLLGQVRDWMTPERALALQGIGLGMSQLAAGRPADLSPVHAALSERQRAKKMREGLEAPEIAELFTPQQRAVLAQMPEAMAMQIVAQRMFETPQAPAPINMAPGNTLFDPASGQPIFTAPERDGADPTRIREYEFSQAQRRAQGLPEQTFDEWSIDQRQAGATNITTNVGRGDPVYGDPPTDQVWLRDENGQVVTEPDPSGRGVRPVAAPIGGTRAERDIEADAEKRNAAVEQANQMIATVDGILNDPALDAATGLLAWTQRIPGTGMFRFGTRARQLEGQAFLQAFEGLKGGGQITEIEGQKATQAIGRLDTAQSAADYRAALNELKDIIKAAALRAGASEDDDVNDLLELYRR